MNGLHTSLKTRWGLLLCVCTALGSHRLHALDRNLTFSQYIVTRWDSRDSFPGGAINAIAQTPDGYLWIGAEEGLVRFDGVNFRLIDHKSTPSLPPGHVLDLAVDSVGVLWVRMGSPYLLRYRGGRFEQAYPSELPPLFSPIREFGATAIAHDATKGVLIATADEPLRLTAGRFASVLASRKAIVGIALSVAETGDGAVWVGTSGSGLFSVREGRASQVTGVPDQKVNVLLPGLGPELWVGTDAGLVRWDGSSITHRGVPAALAHSPILALARDRDSNLWISTPAGISRLDSSGSFTQEMHGSTPGVVHAILEDREGGLWLGGTGGLMQLRNCLFLTYAGTAGYSGSLYVDASKRTWVAPASGGLIWIRGAEHHSVVGLDKEVIYSISGGFGEVWAGRQSGGVTQLSEEAGNFVTRTFTEADGLAPGAVSAVRRVRDGSVWAGTLSGTVSRIHKGRITIFRAPGELRGDAITTIEETPDGVIWAGTAGGVEAFRSGRWHRYGGENGLPPGRVNSLAVDKSGILWVGSSTGLLYWSGARFEFAGNIPDLVQGEVYGLIADDAGDIWASTDHRVLRVSRSSLLSRSRAPVAIREFGTADGLPSMRGTRRDHSVVRDPSGRLWFSLQGGLCVVNPSPPAPPALTSIESVAVDGHPLGMGPAARYSSSHQRIVFDFIGVSLAVPGRVRYRYLLEGYDRDWSRPTESREAAYTNLAPARYTFQVMASNSEGLWNGSAATVSFEVEPQVSQTLWFRVMASCLAAVAIFAIFRYRMARVRVAMQLRFEERLAERTRIARELHDTLLQSFQGLMLRLQVVDDLLSPGKAKEQLELSLRRADQAIAEGRTAVYDLRSPATTTNDLTQAVKSLGDELVTADSAAFHLVVDGESRDLHPIIRDEIYRITREALRNAFSHAQGRNIETEIIYGERALRLRIRDDGKGIPPDVLEAGRSGHYGLCGMRERAQQIGGKLIIWSRLGVGSEIELSIAGSIAYRTPAGRSLFGRFRMKAG